MSEAVLKSPNVTHELVRMHRRARFNPVRGMTPAKLARVLDSFRAGEIRDLALLMDVIEERDDVLQSVMPKRKQAISRHGWEIVKVEVEAGSPRENLANEQFEFLTDFYNNLKVSSVIDQDVSGGAGLLFRQMGDAIGKRYSVHDIALRPMGDGRLSADLWHVPLWFFEATEGKLRFCRTPGSVNGEEMAEGEWLVSVGQGVLIACAVAWMYKTLPLRDWLGYSDKFGFPGVQGKTPAAKGSTEWQNMVDTVAAFANEWSAVTGLEEAITLIEAKGGSANLPFPPLVEKMDRAMATLCRGSDLGTMSKKDGAGASLQGEESDILEQDDALWLSEILNVKLDPLALRWKFGEDTPILAYLKVKTTQRQDVAQEILISDHLVNHGVRLSAQQEAERFGRAIAPDDEPALGEAKSDREGDGVDRVDPTDDEEQHDEDEEEDALNEAWLSGTGGGLAAAAYATLARAEGAELADLTSRLQRALSLSNAPLQQAAFRAIAREWPDLQAALLGQTERSERAMADALSAALFNGMEEAR